MLTEAIVVALWVMLPAYVPNNAAVLGGGGPPIDGGRRLGGRRLLGAGKTWRGTAIGIAAGMLLALALNGLAGPLAGRAGIALPSFPTAVVLALPAGAMAGDIAASFLKRRTGRERGVSFPVVDQLDFVAGALGLALVTAPTWTAAVITGPVLLVIVVMTPLLHLGANLGAYSLGLKDEPY